MSGINVSLENNPVMHSTIVKVTTDTMYVALPNENLKYISDKQWVAKHTAEKMAKMVYEQVYAQTAKLLGVPEAPGEEEWSKYGQPALEQAASWMPGKYAINTTNSASTYTTYSETESDGESFIVEELKKVFSGLDHVTHCPVKDCASYGPFSKKVKLSSLIQHLNDKSHQWSREQIADWLETLDIDIKAKEDNNED